MLLEIFVDVVLQHIRIVLGLQAERINQRPNAVEPCFALPVLCYRTCRHDERQSRQRQRRQPFRYFFHIRLHPENKSSLARPARISNRKFLQKEIFIKTRDMCVGFDTSRKKSFACRNFSSHWFHPRRQARWNLPSPQPVWLGRKFYIASGASTPIRPSALAMVCRAARHSDRRAAHSFSSSHLMRQAL